MRVGSNKARNEPPESLQAGEQAGENGVEMEANRERGSAGMVLISNGVWDPTENWIDGVLRADRDAFDRLYDWSLSRVLRWCDAHLGGTALECHRASESILSRALELIEERPDGTSWPEWLLINAHEACGPSGYDPDWESGRVPVGALPTDQRRR